MQEGLSSRSVISVFKLNQDITVGGWCRTDLRIKKGVQNFYGEIPGNGLVAGMDTDISELTNIEIV